MAKLRQHLARAPITEAVVDFQTRARENVDLSSVKQLSELLEAGYVFKGPLFELQTTWSAKSGDAPRTDTTTRELGIRLHSRDGKYVLQTRTHGFTLSRLEPYETWESLLREARLLWDVYRSKVEVEAVIRVATRFINRLPLPMKSGERFQEYLTSPPDVPNDLPQGVLGFMQRVVLADPQVEAKANVIQLLQEGSVTAEQVPIILDIDVYRSTELAADSEELWATLGRLRRFKNAIFFSSLTEKTVELFE